MSDVECIKVTTHVQNDCEVRKVLVMSTVGVLPGLNVRYSGVMSFLRHKRLSLLPDPFHGMEGWRETMGLERPGNSPTSGSEVV